MLRFKINTLMQRPSSDRSDADIWAAKHAAALDLLQALKGLCREVDAEIQAGGVPDERLLAEWRETYNS